jgi:hypothetical protein
MYPACSAVSNRRSSADISPSSIGAAATLASSVYIITINIILIIIIIITITITIVIIITFIITLVIIIITITTNITIIITIIISTSPRCCCLQERRGFQYTADSVKVNANTPTYTTITTTTTSTTITTLSLLHTSRDDERGTAHTDGLLLPFL